MENASKALLIAAGVLLMILVFSFATLLFRRMGSQSSEFYKDMSDTEIYEFNQQFFNYERDDLKIQDAVDSAFDIFRRCNKYIDVTEPWALAKDEANNDRLKTILYNLSVNIVKGAKLIYSFMPTTSEKIIKMFNVDDIKLNSIKDYLIKDNTTVTKEKENLFVRIETDS